ncbi:hypothetical protein QAD02_023001 [Eretmocerus hayati]|uniref:Uncharacterized protein n=1 Tax=Eretmocerus hayati TaxID=131215 RepID=A0ACC2PXZ1_9HYME|nr:hypothetical protein QAD02_023001 [Eretmocerus hayati]
MRNPALYLVGIAASPGGGGVFGTRAEEELRHWLELRLDALGIDPVAYSRFVLSLLRRPDSALSPPVDIGCQSKNGGAGRRSKARSRSKLPPQGDREQRRAVVQCLTNAADQKCGIESLVDELCAKLKDLEGSNTKNNEDDLKTATHGDSKVPFETLNPRDQALRYYAAFPALQPRKNKITTTVDTQSKEEKEDSDIMDSMEQVKDSEQELMLDQLRLAQLQAKFDESLEALWDSGPGISQNTDSIWAAPSLSIPSGPLWPDASHPSFSSVILPAKEVTEIPLYQEPRVEDSPLIPWDIDLFSIEDCADEFDEKIDLKNSAGDGPWRWGGLNGPSVGQSPSMGSYFFPVIPNESSENFSKESYLQTEVPNLPEPDEDLLTSARTHFRPIKEDGQFADGTTFPVDNNLERVSYRRSESGNLLYLPGDESPYMEYRESPKSFAVSTNLTLKFRVRQCDKSIQTEPLCSPTKRRILSEQDCLFYSANDSDGLNVMGIEEIEKDSFNGEQVGWEQPLMLLHNERKRRHSSNFKARPLAVLRPLTL